MTSLDAAEHKLTDLNGLDAHADGPVLLQSGPTGSAGTRPATNRKS